MMRRPAQILGLVLNLVGLVLVSCTLAMDQWRVSQRGGQGSSVVLTSWYWSGLWKDCYEDSTAVVNCVDLGVLWTVKPYVQAVRGLLLSGLCSGLVGVVLMFLGMECTRVGGDMRSKDRMLAAACGLHVTGCILDVAGYCLYINRVAAAFLHSKADPTKISYQIGPPVYGGLVGTFLIFLGSSIHCGTSCRLTNPERHTPGPTTTEEEEEEVLRRKTHSYRQRKEEEGVDLYKTSSVVMV